MSSTSTSERSHRSLSRLDWAILSIHSVIAATVGLVGIVSVDPDWAGLQRFVIVMLTGLWAGGIVTMGYIARWLRYQWARKTVLLVGPFLGVVVVFGRSMLGAG